MLLSPQTLGSPDNSANHLLSDTCARRRLRDPTVLAPVFILGQRLVTERYRGPLELWVYERGGASLVLGVVSRTLVLCLSYLKLLNTFISSLALIIRDICIFETRLIRIWCLDFGTPDWIKWRAKLQGMCELWSGTPSFVPMSSSGRALMSIMELDYSFETHIPFVTPSLTPIRTAFVATAPLPSPSVASSTLDVTAFRNHVRLYRSPALARS
jgi:hypothetical protein